MIGITSMSARFQTPPYLSYCLRFCRPLLVSRARSSRSLDCLNAWPRTRPSAPISRSTHLCRCQRAGTCALCFLCWEVLGGSQLPKGTRWSPACHRCRGLVDSLNIQSHPSRSGGDGLAGSAFRTCHRSPSAVPRATASHPCLCLGEWILTWVYEVLTVGLWVQS